MGNSTELGDICSEGPDVFPFENFAPTLAQCFIIVITGYLVAKFQLLSAADLRGVNAFVAYIGMPGIVCMTLADADFGDFRWELLLGLFLGKAAVFALVAFVATQINGSVGVAGLLGIFCVHSNDLPVGNPLMSALYKNDRPQMMKYLFMMPAMTMVIFVPLGTFMLEIHKSRQALIAKQQSTNEIRRIKWSETVTRKEVSALAQSVLKATPVVIATVLGVTLNFSFNAKMPKVLHQPFQVVAATVPGCVLSLLGFNMVRKERYLVTSSIVSATALIAVRMFVTPIVLHTITSLLTDQSAGSKMLSDFGLLYGIVSPATAIFLAGQEFRKPLAAMSATLIVSSFLSFPLSYAVARFTIVPACKMSHYSPVLRIVALGVACFSLACDIIVVISVLWKRKLKKVPYSYVLCLVTTQISTCSGILLWSFSSVDTQPWSPFFQTALLYGGEISTYVWMGAMALVGISAKRHPSLAQGGFSAVCVITFLICGVITTMMCVLVICSDVKSIYVFGVPRSNFEYLQLGCMTVLQAICLIVVGTCLVLHLKDKHMSSNSLQDDSEEKPSIQFDFDNPIFFMDSKSVTPTHYAKKRSASVLSVQSERDEADLYYQEVMRNRALEEEHQPGACANGGREWTFPFFSLLLLLLTSTSMKFVSNIYKMVHSRALEIMIPLEFLQVSLFIGQGFFILLTFGIDVRTMTIAMTKWWRTIRFGKEEFVTALSDVDPHSSVAQFCNQFNTFYISKCFQNIAKDRQWKDGFYRNCFWGHQLVDWLIQEGVAKDDIEAEELGQSLLLGGVISHVTGVHHFHDAPYLYHFLVRKKFPVLADDRNAYTTNGRES